MLHIQSQNYLRPTCPFALIWLLGKESLECINLADHWLPSAKTETFLSGCIWKCKRHAWRSAVTLLPSIPVEYLKVLWFMACSCSVILKDFLQTFPTLEHIIQDNPTLPPWVTIIPNWLGHKRSQAPFERKAVLCTAVWRSHWTTGGTRVSFRVIVIGVL